MKQLDPKYVWQYFMRGMFAVLLIYMLPFGGGLLAIDIMGDWPGDKFFLIFGWTTLFVIFVLWTSGVWILAKLTYRFYRYELRDEGFRKESGIIWKKYHTIPYGRIQNVDIYRGISDRILGLSHILIQTAGSSNLHFQEGRLPGLSVKAAERLRDELIRRANRLKASSGV